MLVKRNISRIFTFVCLFIMSNLLYAAQFIASVSATQIEVGQSLELSLTLKDAKAKGAPDLNNLAQDFSIYSQQQYSTFSSINGSVTTEAGWDIVIVPNRQGQIAIPSVNINTDKGVLSTVPINIKVVAAGTMQNNKPSAYKIPGQNSNLPSVDTNNIGVSLVATTNKSKTYVKEPIVYTLKIISYRPINNVALEDIKATDAIIDKLGQPKQYDQTVGGMRAHIIEIKYYITPLVAGKITIQPAIIRGEVYVPSPNLSRSNHFGMFNNFFIDDPLQFKPFTVRGDQITINTIAPAVKGNEWMPLSNLVLSEEWTGLQDAKVGSSIGRKVKIVATGGFSNQLPSVKQAMEIDGVKTYADNPVFSDEVKPDTEQVIGTKEEQFSIVPVQAGKISFPEIKIQWWNLQTKQSEVTTLPAKTIEIMPAVGIAANDSIIDFTTTSNVNDSLGAVGAAKNNEMLYALIACLTALIVFLIAAIAYLIFRKQPVQILKRSFSISSVDKVSKPNRSGAKLEREITSAADLRDAIMEYSCEYWQVPKDLTLNKLGTFLTDNNYDYDLEVYILLCKEINDEMYAASNVDLEVLLDAWELFKRSVSKNKPQNFKKNKPGYINLNPT